MAQKQISIVGAGIAGLILGRCLLKRGIRSVLYEKDATTQRYGYGITLRSSTCSLLLSILDIDKDTFTRRIAVDGPIGGFGREVDEDNHECLRANRARFEELLREGLDVRWEHKLTNIKSDGSKLSLEFENGQKVDADTVIGAEGVHSQVRKILHPNSEVKILPFAVYNGKRRLDATTFDKKYAPYLNDVNIISHKTSNALLQISVNERTDGKASISYTYSREAKQPDDPLFRPNRSIPGASSIPEEFFSEIENLSQLEEPFKEVFNAKAMEQDRMLNWLMRSVHVSESDLQDAAANGVVLMGDSAHHGPILGSDGANEAVVDAMELVEDIAQHEDRSGLLEYCKKGYSRWRKQVSSNEARLEQMHYNSRSTL